MASQYKALTHDDQMPIGKIQKGKKMIDVPASWFKWFKENGSPGNIMDYIDDNWESIQEELDTQENVRKIEYNKEIKKFKEAPSKSGPITHDEIRTLMETRNLDITGVLNVLIEDSTHEEILIVKENLINYLDQVAGIRTPSKPAEKMLGWGEELKEPVIPYRDGEITRAEDLPF